MLTLTRPLEAPHLTDPTQTPDAMPEGPQEAPARPRTRPVPRDHLPTIQERREARELARQYRALAEDWYRALRAWDVREPAAPPPISYAPFTDGWEPVTTLGEGGRDLPTALMTPIGELREVEVGRLISTWAASSVPDRRAAGALLERVRGAFTAPRSLLEDGGWAYPAPRHAGYAVAVLSLAVQFGDARAEAALVYAQAVLRRQH
ncbi:hypothetical protein [Deinococcus apachensis]|uniref:hypothetical protein n=1 Tax=Deinococcus apachensis TaxID=309886 RepID=UPI00035DA477|nr:hypothetical protein [Deinococcus apachensis]